MESLQVTHGFVGQGLKNTALTFYSYDFNSQPVDHKLVDACKVSEFSRTYLAEKKTHCNTTKRLGKGRCIEA